MLFLKKNMKSKAEQISLCSERLNMKYPHLDFFTLLHVSVNVTVGCMCLLCSHWCMQTEQRVMLPQWAFFLGAFVTVAVCTASGES